MTVFSFPLADTHNREFSGDKRHIAGAEIIVVSSQAII